MVESSGRFERREKTPMAKVLQEAFGIERAFMTTVHAYAPTQALLDGPHKGSAPVACRRDQPDPDHHRRHARARHRLPELGNRIAALAIRAPVSVGSIVDLVAERSRPADRDEVNAVFRRAAERPPLAGILRYPEGPLISSDILRSPYSSIFDSQLRMSMDRLVKVLGWYDNEWGYSCRVVDLVGLLSRPAAEAG